MLVVDARRRPAVLQRLPIAALLVRYSSQLVVRVGFVRVDRDRLAESLDRGLLLPALDINQAKLIVRVGVPRIERGVLQPLLHSLA